MLQEASVPEECPPHYFPPSLLTHSPPLSLSPLSTFLSLPAQMLPHCLLYPTRSKAPTSTDEHVATPCHLFLQGCPRCLSHLTLTTQMLREVSQHQSTAHPHLYSAEPTPSSLSDSPSMSVPHPHTSSHLINKQSGER